MDASAQHQPLNSNDSQAVLIKRTESEEVEIKDIHSCGYGSCRPSCMQSFANVRLFTVIICLLACTNGAISASYLPSVITSIERRFEFSSGITGLVVGSYEIGATIAVIFVSYLGSKRNIPAIIGFGTILVGTGTCLFALPHFIASPYSLVVTEDSNRTSDDSCFLDVSDRPAEDAYCTFKDLKAGAEVYVIIFVLAQSLIGIGSTPILTIGLYYIDIHVPRKKSPQYLAFVYASATLGPVLGFGCGAALMEVYVDFTTPSVVTLPLTPTDSQWVGAWWVGFLIFGCLTMLSAPPFFAFPKSLPSPAELYRVDAENEPAENEEKESFDTNMADSKNDEKWTSFKEFPQALLKLLKNPVYMLINLATVFEMVIVTGFITFIPKYLETQFDLRTSEANLYTGSLAIPGAALGILSSGAMLRKLKLTIKGTLQFTVILSVLGLACFSLAFVLGCSNTKIAGITTSYHKSLVSPNPLMDSWSPSNLTNECNSDCMCTDNVYNPVCGDNSITYFSACHAGCRLDSNGTIMQGCKCLDTSADALATSLTTEEQPFSGHVTRGACDKNCNMLIPFMILVLAISFFLAGLKTPITTLIMRCVDENLRSFSLGIQMVVIRTCALLPAPIIFGNIIDTTCLWWKYECGERKNCLIYNVESFRYELIGICAGLHFMGLLTFIAAWYLVKRQECSNGTADAANVPNQTATAFYVENDGNDSLQLNDIVIANHNQRS